MRLNFFSNHSAARESFFGSCRGSFGAALFLFLLAGCATLPTASADELESAEFLASPPESANQQPLELMHRTFVPTGPFALHSGSLAFSLDGAWANTVNRRKSSYLFDAETRMLRPSLRIGVVEGVELQLDQPLLWRGGGFTDPLIDGWHQSFGMPRGPRQFVPDDTLTLEGDTRDGGQYSENRGGLGLSDGLLGTRIELLRNARSVLSTQLSASIPTGRSSYGQSASDLTAALLGSYKFSDLWIFAGAGYSYLSDPWEKQLLFRRQQVRGFVGASYFLNDHLVAYLGVNGGGAFLSNIERFPDYQIYLDAALRRRFGEKSFLSLLVRENPAPSQGTTDIEIQLGYSYLF